MTSNEAAVRMSTRPLPDDVFGGEWYGVDVAVSAQCEACGRALAGHPAIFTVTGGGGNMHLCIPCAEADCLLAEGRTK